MRGALLLLLWPGSLLAQGAPLSAIDWLSPSVAAPAPAAPPRPAEPPVAADASAPGITVTSLDAPAGGALGLLPPSATGLPRDLWARSDGADLAALIRAEPAATLPALRELVVTLMLAEAEAPAGAESGEALFLARVDKLLDMGALPEAQALLESGDLLAPETFRRWFDVLLLTGAEARACEVLRAHPSLAPTLMARVFCLARNDDWPAAALTLGTARALGDVSAEEDDLLSRFLDPEFADEAGPLVAAPRASPLVFRLREAIGEALPTAGLPLAFSHADLRSTVAWRARIEAAERLARSGALAEDALLAVYGEGRPAASGGVWDRAAAVQDLEAALDSGDAGAVAAALAPAWDALSEQGLEVPLARLTGARLLDVDLEGEAAALAFRVALLSPAYESAALARAPMGPEERLWAAVARGDASGMEGWDGPSTAVVAGFGDAAPPEALAAALAEGRVGEAILGAVDLWGAALDGDHAAAAGALATLRALGLEDVARRAALEFLVLRTDS